VDDLYFMWSLDMVLKISLNLEVSSVVIIKKKSSINRKKTFLEIQGGELDRRGFVM
jgi:hypothetical protein